MKKAKIEKKLAKALFNDKRARRDYELIVLFGT